MSPRLSGGSATIFFFFFNSPFSAEERPPTAKKQRTMRERSFSDSDFVRSRSLALVPRALSLFSTLATTLGHGLAADFRIRLNRN